MEKQENPLSGYDNHRDSIFTNLSRLGIPLIWMEFFALPVDILIFLLRIFLNRTFSIWLKLQTVLAILYFIIPDDLIPDYFLPGIGFIDDILVFLVVLHNLFSTIKTEDKDVLEKLWSGNLKVILIVDYYVERFGKWAQRVIVVLAIIKIISLLIGGS